MKSASTIRPGVRYRWLFVLLSLLAISLLGCTDSRKSKKKGGRARSAVGKKSTAPKSGAKAKKFSPREKLSSRAAVVFLHHSTGENIYNGGVAGWISNYNREKSTQYGITERAYPNEPYPWDNYPYDYWNIWVKHAGAKPYRGQDTLEILTKRYQVIVFKHCYPVSAIEPKAGGAKVASQKTLANYQAQYRALKNKLRSFAATRFIVWTGAALTRTALHNDYSGNADTAKRARKFFDWVKNHWDEQGDNIFVFDFYELETEGGQYMLDKYAQGAGDPHPNEAFARKVAPLFAKRVVDVIEGRGDSGSKTGR